MEPVFDLKSVRIDSSSGLHVRVATSVGSTPVVIAVQRAAIDDYFRLTESTKEFRSSIVERNLDVIIRVAEARYISRRYTDQKLQGVPFIQIVLTLTDLQGAELELAEDDLPSS
jgi:MinD superfamily P-loop ATPase